MFKIWNINILGVPIEQKWEQGDLDIYFGRWEHSADGRFWEMGAPSEKNGRLGDLAKKMGDWEIQTPHRGPQLCAHKAFFIFPLVLSINMIMMLP